MATKSVNVLLPNGHRQNIKVSPNTTILQVLDEACQKYGLQAENYDIKNLNKVLDVNSSFRFTNLPNNAQLEMVPCIKKRELLNITIGLQLEDGHRLMGDFQPNTLLNEILLSLAPSESTETAVVVFMHQEISGKDLENTTLRSLGLTKGKAMLRLLHRDPNSKKEQAHVYIPAKKPVSKENDNPSTSSSFTKFISNKIIDPINSIKAEVSKQIKEHDLRKDQEKETAGSQNKSSQKIKNNEKTTTAEVKKTPKVIQNILKDSLINVAYLGERNALVFNQAGALPISQEDLPDSFFDLTVEDAKVLLRDAKKSINRLEDSPLLTEALRETENNKKKLEHVNKYHWAIIRIQFPDQLVLQGLFRPEETVQDIKNFVRNYLKNPENEFVLYTTPPKTDLNPNCRLIDENLVPSAVIYYSGHSPLKPELKNKLTDPLVATVEAMKAR
ncbi:tether containing UBX domain for GLUT4 isoform X2 [Leptopilina heterotoma]|nr:tether containing UBX domain for GLUT4 isoform X2 [Leptopilina heterotoma]